MDLAADVSLGGFALGVEGVEVLVQTLFGGLARVDRAAGRFGLLRRAVTVSRHVSSLACRPARKRQNHSNAFRLPPALRRSPTLTACHRTRSRPLERCRPHTSRWTGG